MTTEFLEGYKLEVAVKNGRLVVRTHLPAGPRPAVDCPDAIFLTTETALQTGTVTRNGVATVVTPLSLTDRGQELPG